VKPNARKQQTCVTNKQNTDYKKMLDIDYQAFRRADSDDGEQTVPEIAPSTLAKIDSKKVRQLTQWIPIQKAVPHWTFAGSSSMFLLDCGGRGSCMFHVIAAGLNMYLKHPIFAMQRVRQLVADQITLDNLKAVLVDWNTEEGHHFRKLYAKDPRSKDLLRQVRVMIADPSNRYQTWGDVVMLQLLLESSVFRKLDLGFAVVSSRKHLLTKEKEAKEQKSKSIRIVGSSQLLVQKDTKRVMTLYCHPQEHWQLLGLKNAHGRMACVFSLSKYPKTLHVFLSEQEQIQTRGK